MRTIGGKLSFRPFAVWDLVISVPWGHGLISELAMRDEFTDPISELAMRDEFKDPRVGYTCDDASSRWASPAETRAAACG